MDLPWLHPTDLAFPPISQALTEPNGLLAAGGDLRQDRLVAAYRQGIFPWFEEDQPILWWSPDPRCVLFPDRVHVSRSLKKCIASGKFTLTMDRCFATVMEACAAPRAYTDGTWINQAMIDAYNGLFDAGIAHSIEVWEEEELVGGLYGLAIGQLFFGESMFSRRSNASKVALVHLCGQLQAWGYQLIDCQVDNPHLQSLGAEHIGRAQFATYLDRYSDQGGQPSPWALSWQS